MEKNSKDIAALVARIVFSGLMIQHGWSKFLDLFNGGFADFPDPIGFGPGITHIVAVLGEFVGPILMIIGFKTRWASIFPIITMLVATFVTHGDDILGKGEKAFLFLAGFIVIAALGSGKYSLDRLLKKG